MKLLQRVIFCFSLAGAGFAQSQAINGSIRGHVIDPGGSSVPEAKVGVLNPDTGFTRSVADERRRIFRDSKLAAWFVLAHGAEGRGLRPSAVPESCSMRAPKR